MVIGKVNRMSKDTIYRQDAVDAINELHDKPNAWLDLAVEALEKLPPAEPVKAYTKVDYIMALHKEYGCTLTMAEEAHNKALEYLRSKARMKG